jgi:hypothetical protein
MIIAGTSVILHFTESIFSSNKSHHPMSKDVVVVLSGIVEIALVLLYFWKKQRVAIDGVWRFSCLGLPGNIAQIFKRNRMLCTLDSDNARLSARLPFLLNSFS